MAFIPLGSLADGYIQGGDASERWKSEDQRREFEKKDSDYKEWKRGLEKKDVEFEIANRAAVAPGTPTRDDTFSKQSAPTPGAGQPGLMPHPQEPIAPGGHDQVITSPVATPQANGTQIYNDNQPAPGGPPGAPAGGPQPGAQPGLQTIPNPQGQMAQNMTQGTGFIPTPGGANAAGPPAAPGPNMNAAPPGPMANVDPGITATPQAQSAVPQPGAAPSEAPAIPPRANVPVQDKQIQLPPQQPGLDQKPPQPTAASDAPVAKIGNQPVRMNMEERELNDYNARIEHARNNGRGDVATRLMDQSAPLREKVRLTAMGEADQIYRASGDPRALATAYNRYVHDGGNIVSIAPAKAPDGSNGYKVEFTGHDGQSGTQIMSKSQFDNFRNQMVDPAKARAAEAAWIDEQRKSSLKIAENKAAEDAKPYSAKPNDTVWVTGQDGQRHQIQRGTIDPRENFVNTPNDGTTTYIGPGPASGAQISGGAADREYPKAVMEEADKAAGMAKARFGSDQFASFTPEIQAHIAKQSSDASRMVLANHNLGNQMGAAEASAVAEGIDTGKLKVEQFQKNGVTASGVMYNGRVIFTDPAETLAIRGQAAPKTVKSTMATKGDAFNKRQAELGLGNGQGKSSDRASILSDERDRESAHLAQVKSQLESTTNDTIRKTLSDEVARSQGNVDSLSREIASLTPGLRRK